MAAEKKEQAVSAELAVKREMECRRRVQEILGPKKETADKLLFQSSYPRKNDQAPFGDRKLGERSNPNHTKRSFPETQNAWQRSQLQIREKRQKGPQPHPRGFMLPPKPNPRPYSASASWGTSAPERLPISKPSPSVSVPDQKPLCEVCKVECSSPFNYRQHISGKKHKAELIKVAQGGKKGDNKEPKCELCGIVCTDESSLRMHINGRKHKAKVSDSQVLGQNKMDA